LLALVAAIVVVFASEVVCAFVPKASTIMAADAAEWRLRRHHTRRNNEKVANAVKQRAEPKRRKGNG
jgi:hypothetical protein